MQPPDPRPSDDSGAGAPAAPPALLLAASLELTHADALRGDLQHALAHDGALVIDGSGVERVSTACIQLLVAAAAGARVRGLAFQLAATSVALTEAIRDLGLCRALCMKEG